MRIVTSFNSIGLSRKAWKFTFQGPFSDTGAVTAAAKVTDTRLVVVEWLHGKKGTLRIQTGQSCNSRVGDWKITAGTGSYRGLSGGGQIIGQASCAAIHASVRLVAQGTITGYKPAPPKSPKPPLVPTPTPVPTPPPPVPLAGHYLGTTSNLTSITFDVGSG